MTRPTVADTLCALSVETPLPAQPIDPPTISVTFGINDSPLAGRDGDKVQSRVIRARLMREAESNVAIHVTDTPGGEAFEVHGRGELQMGVLIENMRREGFELSVSRPRVLYREEGGQRLEPIEEVTVDVDDDYTGVVVQKLAGRKGEVVEMRSTGAGKTRIVAQVPSRGLIGYHGEFLTDTRGTGVLNRVFHAWAPYKGAIPGRRRGVLISMEDGEAVAYALWNLEERGRIFVSPGDQVYQGHGHRRAFPRQRSRGEPAEGQEADQRPRRRQGRGRHPDAAGALRARGGDRLCRRRRARRGDAARHPAAQAPSRPA